MRRAVTDVAAGVSNELRDRLPAATAGVTASPKTPAVGLRSRFPAARRAGVGTISISAG